MRVAVLVWLCCSPAATLLLRPAGFAASAQARLRPRACSGGAVMLDSPFVEQLPTLLVAIEEGNKQAGGNPLFSEVFLAGASIALASVVATVFVGILVRGNYDDLEASFFEAQDDSLEESREKDSRAESSSAARDFFGDVNVREAAPTPTAQPQGKPDEK